MSHTLGQLWTDHPDDVPARPEPAEPPDGSRWRWSWTRRARRIDDDWGWRTVVRFQSHRDGMGWLADLGGRRGRLVTELVGLTLPGALAELGTRRRITDLVHDLDNRLRTDLLLPTRPLITGATTPAWVDEQVQAIEDEMRAPGTAERTRLRRDRGAVLRWLSSAQYRALRAHLVDVLTGAGITPDWVPTLVAAIEAVPVGWLTHPAVGATTPHERLRRPSPLPRDADGRRTDSRSTEQEGRGR